MNQIPPQSFSYKVQPRPFKSVRAGKNSNIPLTAGYQGADGPTYMVNSYYFSVDMFGSANLRIGDKILLYAQTNSIENGIWSVSSIISGYVNIQRPLDPGVNSGDMVLFPSSNYSLLSRISALENRLASLEGKN